MGRAALEGHPQPTQGSPGLPFSSHLDWSHVKAVLVTTGAWVDRIPRAWAR